MPIGKCRSFALFTNLQAEYVARLLPTTRMRLASSMALSAAILISEAMDSPNMTTAGFRTPAFEAGDQAPSSSTSTEALVPSAKIGGVATHVGQAGYLKVVYGAFGTSTSPSGLLLSPLAFLSAGFSESNAPVANISSRKVAHCGFNEDSESWKWVRGR